MHPARWYVQTCEPGQSPGRCPTVGTGEDEPPCGFPDPQVPPQNQTSNKPEPTNQSRSGLWRPPATGVAPPSSPRPPPHHRGGVCRWWGGEGWSLLSFSNTRGHVEVMCVNRVSGDLRVKRGNQGSRVWTGWMPHASWYSISFLLSLACFLHSHVSFCHEQPRMSA